MSSKRNIRLIYLFNLLGDFRIYSPIAIIYFSQVSGSYALGMSVSSVMMLSSAIFEVPTGIFSDFIGRRLTTVFGAVSSFVSIFLYAFGFSYWFLIAGAVFEGVARSFYSGNNQALIYDSLAEEEKTDKFSEVLGKTSSFFQLALALSAILGAFISNWSLQFTFVATLIFQFIGIIIALLLVEPKRSFRESTNIYSHILESMKLFKNNRKLKWVSIASVLSVGIGESMWLFKNAFINLYLPIWSLGLIQAISNFSATLSFYFSGKLIKKFGELKILNFGTVYGRFLDFLQLLFPSAWTILFGSTGSLLFGVTVTAQGSLLHKEFTDHQRATLGSLNSLAGSLFFGVFSVLLGLVADKLGPVNALLIANVLLIIPGLIYMVILKKNKSEISR